MTLAAQTSIIPFSRLEQLREGRAVVESEAAALSDVARRLDAEFCDAAQRIHDCTGSVIVTGIGKAGLIGRKIAATLSSTGTRSHSLHPVEAVHGDLGCLHRDDVLLALSNSGETEELNRLLPIVKRLGVAVIAVTASESSTLGRAADICLRLGRLREAGPLGLAPTTSTTAMLALGDALALVVSRMRGFTPQQFAVFHPGGSLGQQLKAIADVMRTGDELRVASESETIRAVFVSLSRPGRRTGAVMLVDGNEKLTGLFTDSDLARLLEQRREFHLDRPISEVMTPRPLTVCVDAPLQEAIEALSRHKVSELPVVDVSHRPVGLIDITDVLGLMPREEQPDRTGGPRPARGVA